MAYDTRSISHVLLVASVLGGLFASTSLLATYHEHALDRTQFERYLVRMDAA